MPNNQNPVYTDDTLRGDGTEENPLGSAASSAVAEITSVDNSVAITNPTGPTTDLSVNAPSTTGDGQVVLGSAGSPGKLKFSTDIWRIVQNGAGGTRLESFITSAAEQMLLENLAGGGKGVILNLGAGAGGGSNSGAFVLLQDGSVFMKGPEINIANLQVFANNAAAVAGGLVAGDLYRTGADPDLVAIVH